MPYLQDERCHLSDFNFYDGTGATTGNGNTTGQVWIENNYVHVRSAHPNESLASSWWGLIVTVSKD